MRDTSGRGASDTQMNTEFGPPVDVQCVYKSAPRYTLCGTPAASARLVGPGPGVYYPSLDYVRPGTGQPRAFTHSARIPDMSPQIRVLCNAGPKYVVNQALGKGYKHAQCTLSRADRNLDPVDRYTED